MEKSARFVRRYAADLDGALRSYAERSGILVAISYSRTVFEKNTGPIGDLRDAALVRQLASFYTLLGRLDEYRRDPVVMDVQG